jgi:hypothetical protein
MFIREELQHWLVVDLHRYIFTLGNPTMLVAEVPVAKTLFTTKLGMVVPAGTAVRTTAGPPAAG